MCLFSFLLPKRKGFAALISKRNRLPITLLLLTIVILLPRILSLDTSVNTDERKWLARSGNFYYALTQGDFKNTFQREHPGVTIMWAGTAAFMWRYPTYAQDVPGYFGWEEEEIEPFLHLHGHEPLELLIAARLVLIAMSTIALMGAFLAARRLFGWWAALGGFLLIAFDPFHIALSRMLHLDGLMASLMFLSLLTFLSYLSPLPRRASGSPELESLPTKMARKRAGGERRADLVLSGIAAGLAWLTKSPAFFLIPFMTLTVLLQLHDGNGERSVWSHFWRAIKLLMGWALVGLATYMLFWPALWVNPIGTVQQVFLQAFFYAAEGHGTPTYFNGAIVDGDPGFFFYPITYLWRTTPMVMFGLVFALVAYLKKWGPFAQAETRRVTLVLVIFTLLFMLLMELGSKKSDRYLIPIYLPLDLVAALGWVAAGQALTKLFPLARLTHLLLTVVLIVQALNTRSVFPYLMSYYNPLLGGGSHAPRTMPIGWGEGLEQAARYLNGKPNASALRVASWYHEGSFSYFFKGQSISHSFEGRNGLSSWFKTDYVVLYIQQQQRQLPSSAFVEHFALKTPEKVIQINGINYAQIYPVGDLLPPAFLVQGQARFTDWDGAIRLLDYNLPSEPFAPGESFEIPFYLENLAQLTKDLSVLVRLVDQNGNELLRDEGWPFGSRTSEWKLHEIWRDGHKLTIPVDAETGYYQIRLSFYDPKTLSPLPATDTLTGEPLGDELLVDYLYVGQLPAPPADTLPTELGPDVRLLGAKVQGMEAQATSKPSATLDVLLFWQTQATVTQDYTVFVHVVGADGQLVAQQDQQPLGGLLPTHLWRPNELIVDQATITMPPEALTGMYELHIGMYEPSTGQRLPVSRNGQPTGDSVLVAPIHFNR